MQNPLRRPFSDCGGTDLPMKTTSAIEGGSPRRAAVAGNWRRWLMAANDSGERGLWRTVVGGVYFIVMYQFVWDVGRGKMLLLIPRTIKNSNSYDRIRAAGWAADCKICSLKKLKFCLGHTQGRRSAHYDNHQGELSAKSSSHSKQAAQQSASQKNLKTL
jgi:hypothetical protein